MAHLHSWFKPKGVSRVRETRQSPGSSVQQVHCSLPLFRISDLEHWTQHNFREHVHEIGLAHSCDGFHSKSVKSDSALLTIVRNVVVKQNCETCANPD